MANFITLRSLLAQAQGRGDNILDLPIVLGPIYGMLYFVGFSVGEVVNRDGERRKCLAVAINPEDTCWVADPELTEITNEAVLSSKELMTSMTNAINIFETEHKKGSVDPLLHILVKDQKVEMRLPIMSLSAAEIEGDPIIVLGVGYDACDQMRGNTLLDGGVVANIKREDT